MSQLGVRIPSALGAVIGGPTTKKNICRFWFPCGVHGFKQWLSVNMCEFNVRLTRDICK